MCHNFAGQTSPYLRPNLAFLLLFYICTNQAANLPNYPTCRGSLICAYSQKSIRFYGPNYHNLSFHRREKSDNFCVKQHQEHIALGWEAIRELKFAAIFSLFFLLPERTSEIFMKQLFPHLFPGTSKGCGSVPSEKTTFPVPCAIGFLSSADTQSVFDGRKQKEVLQFSQVMDGRYRIGFMKRKQKDSQVRSQVQHGEIDIEVPQLTYQR